MLKKDLRTKLIFLAIPLGVGLLLALVVNSDFALYQNLRQPAFAPPQFIFPIVWTVLYILMGISSYMVYSRRTDANEVDVGAALMLYALSLILNVAWVLSFFKFQKLLASVAIIFVLVIVICAMIYAFSKVSRLAAALQLPYLVWSIFAAFLNLTIYFLND